MLQHLDLVVTVDTSLAHLSGALGRPTWVLLAPNADWRWLHGREDSPWYPSMRLFRRGLEETRGEVVARVVRALQGIAALH
jgi:ADP-heptose:LPS heptosyltransferase